MHWVQLEGLSAVLTAPGPYTARPAADDKPDWPFWYITNDGRTNILRFPDKPGAVLTDRQTAEAIVAKTKGE